MKYLAMVLGTIFLASCATPINVTPVPTTGSKADGTVVLSYNYGLFQQPNVDLEAAQATALKRCKAWGYKKAEAFEGTSNVCQQYNGYGNCLNMRVDITYQCLN